MPRHLYLITGSSRGLGAAMAEQLLQPGHRLLCIARRGNEALSAKAAAAGVELEQWQLDLGEPLAAAARLAAWLQQQDGSLFAGTTLINNAAGLTHIGHLDDVKPEQLSTALRVGLEAPMQLMAAFLRATRPWPAERRVLNISSGLGRRAMAGEAAYCAIKAGLDHATRSIALDEAGQPNAARLCSLAPGVIDTDMQAQLRAGDPAAFPEHARFVELKASGQLWSADEAAQKVLAYLQREDFGTQAVADVRNP